MPGGDLATRSNNRHETTRNSPTTTSPCVQDILHKLEQVHAALERAAQHAHIHSGAAVDRQASEGVKERSKGKKRKDKSGERGERKKKKARAVGAAGAE